MYNQVTKEFDKLVSFIFIFLFLGEEVSPIKSSPFRASIEMFHKKCHFDTPKVYFIILPHHFTLSRLSDALLFNFIH